MVPTYILYLISILVSLFLSYILVNKACKYSKKIAKYKYVAYVTSFIFIYLGSIKIFSFFNPSLMENYTDLLEHISIPKKFRNKPTTSIDTSIFEQKKITPSTTTVISAPVDAARDVPVAYVDPTPPPPEPTSYVAPTEVTGNTGYTGYTDSNITGYTGFTGYSDFVIFTTGYTGYSGYTGYTGQSEEETVVYVSPIQTEESVATASVESVSKEEEGQSVKKELGNIDMNQLMPFMMGLASSLIAKQPEVNVNVFNDGQSGGPNLNKYNMDNCLNNNRKYRNNTNGKRDLYNYPAGKVRAYDEWKSIIDKDNDYIYVDQNKLNRNPRNSSCPVCPLDINYPFSNYRSGR
jgi:hypothetical protein